MNGCSRRYNNGAYKPTRDMYFTPEEIESMIGFSVNAGNKSDAEFKKWVMNTLTTVADQRLDSRYDGEALSDEPYHWEHRLMTIDFARRKLDEEAA